MNYENTNPNTKRPLSDSFITDWGEKIIKRYRSGVANCFVITGNIQDYSVYNYEIEEYLKLILTHNLEFKNIYKYNLIDRIKIVEGTDQRHKRYNPENESEYTYDLTSIATDQDSQNVIIIDYPELLLGNNTQSMQEHQKIRLIEIHKILNSSDFVNSKNMIIFVSETTSDIHPMILSSSNLSEVNIQLPNYEERLNYINYITERTFGKIDDETLVEVDNLTFTNLTAGLSFKLIEDIVLLAAYNKKLDKKVIIDRKKELIETEYGELIEIMETEGQSLDNFAGQDNIKNYFKDVVIDAVHDNNLDIVPKGILLMGPPGTGKTYFTQCLAGDAGMNSVEFQMSKIKDKWVGQSERNLEKAFSVFRALAPVVVFIDEVEQALQRGDSDTNAADRGIFGMFLAEMSKEENRGKIIWIGATNYPNKLDEALKRAGRFDKKIPFFAPAGEDRNTIIELFLNKSKVPFDLEDKESVVNKILKVTEGATQAEIENIFVKAQELAMRKKQNVIKDADVLLAIEYMISAKNERIQEMENIALLECNDKEFIPKQYIKRQEELRRQLED